MIGDSRMKRRPLLLHTGILFSMTIVIYYTQQWKLRNRITLNHLIEDIEADYPEKSSAVYKNIVRKVVDDILLEINQSLLDDMTSLYSPGRVQDHQMKTDLMVSFRSKKQANITLTIRELTKKEFSKTLEDILTTKPVVVDPRKKKKFSPNNLCDGNKTLPANQKLLVYSLFGNRKEYYQEIDDVMNAISASNLYHTWRVRIYHDGNVQPHVIKKYSKYINVDFCDARKIPKYGDITNIIGRAWRNVPLADKSVDVVCSRDLYSPILPREEDAVSEFIKSDKLIHAIRDHPSHKDGLIENAWCIQPRLDHGRTMGFFEILLKKAKAHREESEQKLINKYVWNGIGIKERFSMQHASFSCKLFKGAQPFPRRRDDVTEYVGCSDRTCHLEAVGKCPVECRPDGHKDWEYC